MAQFAKPIVEEKGCTLWDVEYVREGSERFLRLYIDKDGGVDITDCEAISMLYINLPRKDADLYNTFYNFVLYLGMLLGSMLGTWALDALQYFGETLPLFGLEIWPMQLVTAVRCVLFLLLALYVWRMEPHLQPDTATTA